MSTFSHCILYVENLTQEIEFYEKAFGFKREFVHESGAYAELASGSTKLAFASHELARSNLSCDYQKSDLKQPPQSFEMTFTTSDLEKSFALALEAGATIVAPPTEKPWGQTVAYLRDPEGFLIGLATAIS